MANTVLFMQQQDDKMMMMTSNSKNKNPRQGSSDLSAFAAADDRVFDGDMGGVFNEQLLQQQLDVIPATAPLEEFVLPVISASMLVTGNAVGAGMLVLPDLAAEGPGMGLSAGVFFIAYVMNWISGLAVAQVAIQQHEQSGSEVPSSFQEFAEANLPVDGIANIVSGISIFINSLVLAFNTAKAGQVLGGTLTAASTATAVMESSLVIDPHLLSYGWAALLVGLVSTQSLSNLSQVASMLVMALFASLAGLLLPGLAAVPDPLAVLIAGPTSDVEILPCLLHMMPVVVTTLVYQNIVPTVTRILNYDRMKTMTAITVGSMMPLFMYLAWCVTVLGGGIETTGSSLGGPLMTMFSIVTIAGSSMGALMSLSEEFEMHLGNGVDKKDTFSLPSVGIPVGMALVIGQVFASDIKDALKVAGSFGSPLLYGLIPVAMALSQQKQKQVDTEQLLPPQQPENPASTVVPGGIAGLGVLGTGATALVGTELVEMLHQFML